MADPAWARVAYSDGGSPSALTWPNPQTVTATGAASNPVQFICPAAISGVIQFEVEFISLGGVGWVAIQPSSFSADWIPGNPPDIAWVQSNGAIFVNASYTGIEIASFSGGSTVRCIVNTAVSPAQLFFDTQGSSGGDWNNAYTDTTLAAQLTAGTGGIPLTGLTGALYPAFCLNSGINAEVAIRGASSATYPLVAGASWLPANTALQAQPMLVHGQDGAVVWSDLNGVGVAALQYEFGSALGTWTACGGTTISTGGTATLPGTGTLAQGTVGTILISDPANEEAPSAPATFLVGKLPVEGGTLSAFFSDQFVINEAGTYSKYYAFDFPTTLFFDFNFTTLSGGGSGDGDFGFFQNEGLTDAFLSFGVDLNETPAQQTGWEGQTATSGPAVVDFTTTSSVQGTLSTSISAGLLWTTLTLSNNGTEVTYSPRGAGGTGPLAYFGFNENAVFSLQNQYYSIAFYAPPPPETLTLLSAGISVAGTIDLAGTVEHATLTALDVSTDAGSTFEAATSLSVTGTAWSATLVDTLSAGEYPIVVEDATTEVESNTVTLDVSGESLTLTAVGGDLGDLLTFAGVSNDGPPENVDVSINGTWGSSTSFTSASGTTAAAFSGDGGTITATGTLIVEVRDTDYPYIVSNPLDLVIASGETLLLASATVSAQGTLMLSGTSTNGPPTALNVSVNDGGNFVPCSAFQSASGTINAAWTATGPALSPGTYQVEVQDANETEVISNMLQVAWGGQTGGGSGFPSGGYIGNLPSWTVSDFFSVLQKLMPRGLAWPLQVTAVMNQILAALMPSYARVANAAAALLRDGFPATTVYLLPQWQLSLGLPDPCTPLGATLAQQQAQVVQKFVMNGGQSVDYFLQTAALLGYDITIVEDAPETRVWVIHAPQIAPPVLFRVGQSRIGDSLEAIQGNDAMECVFNQIKPADTVLEFSYP